MTALFFWLLQARIFAAAQVTGQATISGVVTDPSGAVIAGAEVAVTNAATNVSRNSVTNSTGYFEADGLNPGVYKILVTSAGFANLLREGITLEADARLNVPMKLSVGKTSNTVTVNADASLLNTESGSGGQVLTTKQLESLPVSGANTFQFMEIAPGVQSENSQTYSMDGTMMWNGVSNFGTAGVIGANEYSLDGAPNEANGGANAISLSVDEVAEQKMDVQGFDATTGHTDGIAITQTTKSGTNDLHGTLRGLYQNRRWAAMTHFQGLNYRYEQSLNNCTNGPSTSPQCFIDENRFGQPGVHENNDGFGVGGPVFIPKIYDGRNKFFWFTSYDNDIFTDSSANTISLPTLQERNGDFSDLAGQDPNAAANTPPNWSTLCPGGQPYFGQYQIYDPYSVVLVNGVPSRTPVCGNVLPASLMPQNAMVKLYNSLLPTPTNSLVLGSNYQYTNPQPQTFRQFTQRFDYAVSSSNHAFFRWTRAHYTKAGTGFTNGDVDIQQGPRWVDTGAFGWNHIFNANTNLDVTVGATQYKTWCCYYPGYDQYKPSDLGLPTYTDTYAGTATELPELEVSNYQQIGNVDNPPAFYRTLALRTNLTRVQGRHTIRGGFEWREQNFSQANQGNVDGTYSFDDTYTQQNNGTNPAFTQSNWGLSYAAFLMGIQSNASVAYQTSQSLSTPYYAAYVADTWRLSPKLTINPGLRFEYEYGPTEKHNQQIVGWDPNAQLPIAGPANTAYQAARSAATPAQQAVLPASLAIQGGPIYAGVNGASTREFQSDYRFLPRLGIAYQVTSNTVIRAGYGLFFDTLNALKAAGSPASGAPGTPGSLMKTDFSADQDGFSANTSVPSSTTFGTNFVQGVSPLANPFPANASGQQFNQPIGSAAGAMYYAGASPTIYDHGIVPGREQRGSIGIQHQFGSSTMLEVIWVGSLVTDVPIAKSYSFTPGSFYTNFTGMQPNVASNQLLSSQITNPFQLANFSALASSNPVQYNLISHSSYFTQPRISVSSLVHGYPQGGLSLYKSIAESKFQEIQVNVTKRYTRGLTFMGAFQINQQHDRDWFRNGFDPSPSWEVSNNSVPFRFTAEGIYELPFGRGKAWANSGWQSAVFGGFQLNATYEVSPGAMIQFGSEWYIGDIKASNIQLKHPVMHNDQVLPGGHNYIQWLNVGDIVTTYDSASGTCSYSGTKGFVTNASCQPNYNLNEFKPFISGVRAKGPDQVQLSVQRTFTLKDRMRFETRFEGYNIFNRQVFSAFPDTGPTDSTFGQVTGDGAANGSGNARWLDVSGKLRF
jgi:hypothetical protein